MDTAAYIYRTHQPRASVKVFSRERPTRVPSSRHRATPMCAERGLADGGLAGRTGGRHAAQESAVAREVPA